MVVPFDLVANQVVVGIKICGRGPFVCLLDTAVAPSVVDLTLARELGLRVSDDLPGEVAGQGREVASFYPSELPDVRLGEFEVGDVDAVAADLSRLGSQMNQPLHAILGQSFFECRVVQIDYPNRRVRLSPLGFRLGLAEALASATPRASMGARGHIDAHEGVVDSLVLGDVQLSPVATVFLPRAHGDPTRALGNLGNGFLQHTVLTLDYPRRELYIAAAMVTR